MIFDDVTHHLSARKSEIQQIIVRQSADVPLPEEGSDMALLLDALCGAEPDYYVPQLKASARHLAEENGRLSVRMESISRWHELLAEAIGVVFSQNVNLHSQAQTRLGRLTAEFLVTISSEYQATHLEADAEAAEKARRGYTRLQALQRINAAANSALDLDQTMTTAAQAVAEEMHADMCVIFLFDEVSRELQLRATSGPYPRSGHHFALQIGEGYTGWVAEHGHPLNVEDATADSRFASEASAYGKPYRGLLSVPVIFFTGVKLQGVVSVQMHNPHVFSDEDLDFLEIVAGQLAMNIENGRLYEQTDEELRRKVHELSTLHRVTAYVTSTLVLDNVLRIIVTQAVSLSGADRSVLFELDAASQQLRAVASHGFDGADLSHATVAVGQCCVGRVIQSGEPSIRNGCLQTDSGCFLHDVGKLGGDQHAALCAPLGTVHGPLGALCVFSSQRHLLNEHQLQLVVTFANVAAIAMENARLFTETRQGLHTKEVLLREMHHRVKNNLQQVASILNMQRRRARSPEIEQILIESVDRIQGIAATHDLLSSTQLGVAPVDEIARKIVGIVRGNLVPPQLNIRFYVGAAPFHLPTEQATTLAIIFNELIANAIEHGFAGRDHGEIRITAGLMDASHIRLRVADDGRGLPQGFAITDAEGLGLQLVRGLVQSNLLGTVEVFSIAGDPDAHDLPTDSDAPSSETSDPAQPVRNWTVTEIRFPVIQHSPSESDVSQSTAH